MSMLSPQRQGRGAEKVGETIASFPTYEAAQKTVSTLISSEVPARHIAIVGLGLRSVERVTGRLGYALAARTGALNGMLLGLLFSMILVLGTPDVPIQAFVGVIFVGVAIGMLMSIIMYSFIRRRRDFASVVQVVADHYEVTVDADSLTKARVALGRAQAPAAATPGVAVGAAPVQAPADATPPRYGERVTAGTAIDDEPPRYGQRISATPAPVHAEAPEEAAVPAEAPVADPDASPEVEAEATEHSTSRA